ncbi:MAG: amidohydrolase [Bacteroidetes bacterium]|nr:amidohydrolase [Bacteroidota bacterium]
MDELIIALLQVPLVWENKAENLRIIGTWVDSIHNSVDIIVLPEMFSTGFSMNSKKLAETMDGASVSWMRTQASNKNCIICGSLIIEENGKYFNRFIWMPPSGKCSVYDKRHLFRMAGENEHYSEGKHKLIVHYKEWDICLQVCYDLRFPVWSRRTKQENYDLLLYVANWPERRSYAWKSLLPARAIENQSYVVGLNRVGLDGNDINYSGDSMALNFLGESLISAKPGEETILQITLSKPELLNFRKNFPAEQDADQFTLYF